MASCGQSGHLHAIPAGEMLSLMTRVGGVTVIGDRAIHLCYLFKYGSTVGWVWRIFDYKLILRNFVKTKISFIWCSDSNGELPRSDYRRVKIFVEFGRYPIYLN